VQFEERGKKHRCREKATVTEQGFYSLEQSRGAAITEIRHLRHCARIVRHFEI
jgi:hypothetical protein